MRRRTRDRVREPLELVMCIATAVLLRPVHFLRRRFGDGSRKHLLIAAPGEGSVGDQAMFEAFVDRVDGTLLTVVREHTVLTGQNDSGRAGSHVLAPGLLYGKFAGYFRDMTRLLLVATDFDTVSVVGADVMDGVYSKRASVRRFNVPFILSYLGLEARVLGFSWNSKPAPEAMAAMIRASARVQLFARDPVSFNRLRADGASNPVQAADLAFLVEADLSGIGLPPSLEPWISAQRASFRKIVVINLCSVVDGRFDQTGMFRALIADKLSEHFSFIFLPHDSRGVKSDEILASSLYAEFPGCDNVFLIERILAPSHVAGLAALVDFVVTGRMHLAILSASVCTPAFAVAYQGKVEGLYKLLGSTFYAESETITDNILTTEFARLAQSFVSARSGLVGAVPGMKSLAMKNIPR